MSITSVKNDTLGKDSFVNSQKPVPPTISGYTISGVDDTALDPAGGQTILINGTGFQRGATVVVDGTTVPVVSFISSNQLSFTSIVKSAGSYAIYVVNADLGTAIYIPGLIYSTLPTWTTGAGSLGSYYETTAISNTVVAGGDAPLTYALASGTLPSGATISSSGVITGTSPADTGSTTYSFTVEAIDAQLQSSTRSFSLTINTDVVTWNSPGTNTTIALDGAAHSSTLSATSAAGYGVAYAADTLPPGLTLIGDTISGTPTTQDTTVSVLTATANTTGRSTTNTITWVVSLGDIFFNLTTMLLSSNATTFVSDASANNLAVTVVGDTKPSNFSPYLTGWSNQFDGTGDYLSVPNNSNLYFGSGDFTVEFWYNSTIPFTTGYGPCMGFGYKGGTTTGGWVIYRNTVINTDRISVRVAGQGGAGFVDFPTSSTVETNKWNHWALVRSGTSLKWYKNGVLDASTTNSVNITDTDTTTLGYVGYAQQWGYNAQCYLSNVRIVKGTAVYTDNFTTPTQPLTSIAGTSLLTCQSNRIRDASSNNFAITRNGDVAIQSFSPFTETATTRGSGYFDGTGDYLTVPANTNLALGAGDYTVECWVNLQGTQTTQYGWGVFGTYPGSGAGGWSLTVNRSQGGQGIVWILGSTIIVDYTGAYIPTNTWAHIAVCRSGSGTNNTKIFLNGVMVNQVTNNTNDNFSGLTYIGGQGTGQLFTGYISNARVVKGTAVYTANFTPPTAPLTAVANTSLLTLQNNTPVNNNTFLDSSSNNLLVTRAGNATQGTFSPYSPSGWSNYFDGNGDWLTFTNTTGQGVNFGTGSFTVELWYYMTDSTTNSTYHTFIRQDTATNAFDFGYRPGLSQLSLGAGNVGEVTASVTLAKNTWNHIAVSRSGTSLRFFVNGAQVGTTATNSYNFGVTGGTVRIGGNNFNAAYTVYGYLSNLRCTKSALYTANFTPSTQPLTAIAGTTLLTCSDNRFVDDSPNNLVLTCNGEVRIQNFSPFKAAVQTPTTYSAYFDGAGDYLTLPSNQAQFSMSTGDFTIEMWVYIPSLASTRTLYDTMNSGDTTGTGRFAMQVTTSGTVQIFTGAGAILTSGGTVTVGAWTHIAYAKASNSGRLYVNGTQVNSAYTDNNNYVVGSTSRPIIGVNAYDNSTNPMLGYISNLRLVKGTAVYTANFTPSTSPLTVVADTSLLTCQNATFTDNSTNRFAVTATGNAQPTIVNPFGSTFTNSSGYTAAEYSGSMYFAANGNYLSTANAIFNISSPATQWTMEMWVYPITSGHLFCIGSGGAYGNGFVCNWGLESTNKFNFFQSTGGSNINSITTTNTFLPYQWYHLAISKDASGVIRMFVNGVQENTVVTNTSTTVSSGTTAVVNGAYDNNGLGNNGGSRFISNLRFIKGQALYTSSFVPSIVPLPPVQNTVLLLNGTSAAITDATTKNVLETVGDVKTSNFGPYSGSYYSNYFDGSGDYLSLAANSAFDITSGDFTVQCWVYNTGPGAERYLFSQRGSGSGWEWRINATNLMQFFFTSGSTLTSTSTIPANAWTHLAVTRSGNILRMFINGIQDSSTTFSSGSTAASVALYLGWGTTGGGSFLGYISNATIVKGTAVYTSNFTPSTTPLTAVSGTSLLTCQSNKFVDNSTNNFAITRVGDARVATQNPFQVNSGQSIIFDGTGDYVLTPTTQTLSFETGDFTVECWVYLNSFGASYVPIFNNAYLFYVGASGQMLVYNGSSDVATGPNGAVSLNSWFHLSWVRTSGTIKMFVNGVQSGSNATVTASIGSGSPNRIGAHSAAHLNGYISDLRITKGTARYTTNFTAPITALQNK